MKFVSYQNSNNEERAGLLIDDAVYDLYDSAKAQQLGLPVTMAEFLNGGASAMEIARKVEAGCRNGDGTSVGAVTEVSLLAPVPHPPSQ